MRQVLQQIFVNVDLKEVLAAIENIDVAPQVEVKVDLSRVEELIAAIDAKPQVKVDLDVDVIVKQLRPIIQDDITQVLKTQFVNIDIKAVEQMMRQVLQQIFVNVDLKEVLAAIENIDVAPQVDVEVIVEQLRPIIQQAIGCINIGDEVTQVFKTQVVNIDFEKVEGVIRQVL